MKTESLKPCPFCGGKVTIEQYCKNGLVIRCPRCAVKRKQKVLTRSLDWLKERMISDWNTRQALAEAEKAGRSFSIEDIENEIIPWLIGNYHYLDKKLWQQKKKQLLKDN